VIASLAVVLTLTAEGLAYSCVWTFTGGSPPSSTQCAPPPVTFPTPGPKTVRLTLCSLDNPNRCTTATKTLLVLDPRPRITAASATPQPAYEDQAITLTASAQGRPPLTFQWVLPDSTALTGASVTLPPGRLTARSRRVLLKVSNADGTATSTLYPNLRPAKPRVLSLALYPSAAYPSQTIRATAVVEGKPPISGAWSFPPGSSSTQLSTSWLVPQLKPGTYLVSFRATNDAGEHSASRYFRVLQVPLMTAFDCLLSPCSAPAGAEVGFKLVTSGPTEIEIDWDGNGVYDEKVNSLSPRHVFTRPGRYRPRARARTGSRTEIRSTSGYVNITPP
jgi:hypothetical protein